MRTMFAGNPHGSPVVAPMRSSAPDATFTTDGKRDPADRLARAGNPESGVVRAARFRPSALRAGGWKRTKSGSTAAVRGFLLAEKPQLVGGSTSRTRRISADGAHPARVLTANQSRNHHKDWRK